MTCPTKYGELPAKMLVTKINHNDNGHSGYDLMDGQAINRKLKPVNRKRKPVNRKRKPVNRKLKPVNRKPKESETKPREWKTKNLES